jgi:pentapeptide MXKDX repeat protein
MKKLRASALATGLLLVGMSAFADDMPKDQAGHDGMKNDKMMSDCMTKMAAKKDGMTHDQMHAACMTEVKNGMGKDNMDKPKP